MLTKKALKGFFSFVLITSSILMPVVSVHAAVLWDGDASKGMSVMKLSNIEGNGSITVITDPEYGQVFKFWKGADGHRAEAHGVKGFQAKEGDLIYIGWRSKLSFPKELTTNAVFQWKAYGADMQQNYPLVIKSVNGNLNFQYSAPGKITSTIWSTPLAIETWNTYVVGIKVSKDANTGYVEFWYNGKQQTLSNNSTRYPCRTLDADYCDPKWGIYGADGSEACNYVGDLKISSDYESAQPPLDSTPTVKPTSTPTSKPTNTPTPTSTTAGYMVSGAIKPDLTYGDSVASLIKAGFKIEVVETTKNTTSDSNGAFEITGIPSGICTVKISKQNYLTRNVAGIAVNSDIQLVDVDIWAGDIEVNGTQDNVINMTDVMEVSKSFNAVTGDTKYNAEVDLNKDNAVNMSDIMIIVKHFNKTSSDYQTVTIVTPMPTVTVIATPMPTSAPTSTMGYPMWDGNFHQYAIGERVSYNGSSYECLAVHTSQTSWDPVSAASLWEKI